MKRDLLPPGAGESPIFPVILGEPAAATAAEAALSDLGIWGHAIRPPTVPAGSSRLRLSLMALHMEEDIHRLVGALDMLRERGLCGTPPSQGT